jgi:hypothetical protein
MEHHHRLDRSGPTGKWVITTLLVTVLTVVLAAPASAQNPAYSFAVGIGGSSSDEPNAIAIDGNNNLFVTGAFQGTVDFDPGAGTSTLTAATYPNGGSDVFVASYDASGNYRWAFNVGGNPPAGMSGSNIGRAIEADGSGNVVVSGLFNGTLDFNPGPGTATLTSVGWTTFVAKYSPTGENLWAFQIGPYSNANDLAVDASGNVVVAGTFQYSVDFDPGSGTATLTSARLGSRNSGNNTVDMFVAKYSPTGAYQWAFRVGNGYAEYADAVDVDGNGNIYVTGSLNLNAVDFNPSKSTASLTGPGNFVAKYTAAGVYAWAFKLGTQGTQTYQRIAADASGNVVVTGRFSGTVDFNPGTGTANRTAVASGPDSYDMYVARYSSSGAYQWAFTPGVGNVWGVACDGNGDIFLTGRFEGENDFDPGSGTVVLERDPLYPAYDEAAFVASYTSGGSYRWAFSIPTVGTAGTGVASNASGDVFVTGSFFLTADFDPTAATAGLTSAGFTDMFIAKYSEPLLPKPADRREGKGAVPVAPTLR